jgi:hypothetical protein
MILGVGNLAVVECLEKALMVANPVAYLYGVARLAIKSYCYKHSQLITQVRGKPFIWVESLEAPLGDGKECLNASRQVLRNNDTMGKNVWKIEEKEGTHDSPNHCTAIR